MKKVMMTDTGMLALEFNKSINPIKSWLGIHEKRRL